MDSMDSRLVAQALNYHGQQLQKIWDGERNESELAKLNLKEPNFEIYQQRQKTLRWKKKSFVFLQHLLWIFGGSSSCYGFACLYSATDRGKRLKLQQFIAKKADTLYDKSNLEKTSDVVKQELGDEGILILMD